MVYPSNQTIPDKESVYQCEVESDQFRDFFKVQ